jgi:2-polyprenyl-3-methyl-5-hydroxy-6-metoxy-1,4-benzoquinol methylase
MTASPACPLCGGGSLASWHVYTAPVAGEPVFATAGDTYCREISNCPACGHFIEVMGIDQEYLYKGDYVSSTWGDALAVEAAFHRINALPPERSDNMGRVAYILDAVKRLGGTPSRLLDVGSGLAVFPHRMKQAGWAVTAIDLDPVLVEHARRVAGLDAHLGDITAATTLARFHLITFNKVLEHVADPVAMLAAAKRHLDDGGMVYVELPDGEAAADEGPGREEFFFGHRHVFSFASYALLAAKAGFRIIECQRLREPSSKYTLRGLLTPR